MSKKQKIYIAEFKAKAIKVIEENNGNVTKTASYFAKENQLYCKRFKRTTSLTYLLSLIGA